MAAILRPNGTRYSKSSWKRHFPNAEGAQGVQEIAKSQTQLPQVEPVPLTIEEDLSQGEEPEAIKA
jgi:hypothetical protein